MDSGSNTGVERQLNRARPFSSVHGVTSERPFIATLKL